MTATVELTQRMNHPTAILPDAMQALLALSKAAHNPSVPLTTLKLAELRASQINGCSVCVDAHCRELKKQGEPDDKIFAVAAWRDNPVFTGAERAAFALTEALTRIADRPDGMPDEVWEEAARHYDEKALAHC